eukprot:UC4_evm1s907
MLEDAWKIHQSLRTKPSFYEWVVDSDPNAAHFDSLKDILKGSPCEGVILPHMANELKSYVHLLQKTGATVDQLEQVKATWMLYIEKIDKPFFLDWLDMNAP